MNFQENYRMAFILCLILLLLAIGPSCTTQTKSEESPDEDKSGDDDDDEDDENEEKPKDTDDDDNDDAACEIEETDVCDKVFEMTACGIWEEWDYGDLATCYTQLPGDCIDFSGYLECFCDCLVIDTCPEFNACEIACCNSNC